MLSPEEREAMRSEAADLRRREMLRSARRAARDVVRADTLLAFLNQASALLRPRASRPHPRRGAGTRYLL